VERLARDAPAPELAATVASALAAAEPSAPVAALLGMPNARAARHELLLALLRTLRLSHGRRVLPLLRALEAAAARVCEGDAPPARKHARDDGAAAAAPPAALSELLVRPCRCVAHTCNPCSASPRALRAGERDRGGGDAAVACCGRVGAAAGAHARRG
jgi:hypothetical protein